MTSFFALLSGIHFIQPALLAGLLAVPVLWYILRITPPAPKTIFFPATAFLTGLQSDEKTPSSSPWWILLLRLLMVALVITALARPVTNPAQSLKGGGALRLFIDNDWASAQLWTQQMLAAEEALTQAARERRSVYIFPTTNARGDVLSPQYGPMPAGEAQSILRGLTPYPWPADYGAINDFLKKQDTSGEAINT
jgi:hypothetical protein